VSLPSWLIAAPQAAPLPPPAGRAAHSFLARSLPGAAEALRRDLFSGQIASRPGFLQRLDPRVKALVGLAFLVAAGLAGHPLTLGVLCLAAPLLALASRVPLGAFAARVYLTVPAFTAILVAPATTNWVRAGTDALVIARFSGPLHLGPLTLPDHLSLTTQGLASAGTLLTRVTASVSIAALFILTTRWTRALGAFRQLRVPALLVAVLGMAYRYLFLLLTTATDMVAARRSRTVAPTTRRSGRREGRRFAGLAAGALLTKAHRLSEDVSLAMISRGFDGDFRAIPEPALRAGNWIALVAGLALAAGVVGGDRLLG